MTSAGDLLDAARLPDFRGIRQLSYRNGARRSPSRLLVTSPQALSRANSAFRTVP
jgi:hypothetical protein